MKARIIKAPGAASVVTNKQNPERARLIGKHEQQAETQARAIRQHAEHEARRLLTEAEAETAELRERSREQVEAAATKQLLDAQQRVEERAGLILDELRLDLTRLGVMIAEKLLGEQLTLAPQSVAHIVSQVLETAGPCRRAVIRINPEDVGQVETRVPELRERGGIEQLVLTADPTIARGGCVLETPLGEVDGRIETQLRTISELIGRGSR